MNTEDYVTYEQAVKLGELGFDWECNYYYNLDKEIVPVRIPCILDSIKRVYVPTLSQAAKWLIEKGLFISIAMYKTGYDWQIEKFNNQYPNYNPKLKAGCGIELFATYEEALSNAIDRALEILEENEIN